ncbi:MAG: 4Fe-4S binding protein [Myxococcota bacterium]
MDQQGQNGLLSTYREGWRNRSWLGIAISASLIIFYCFLYWEGNFKGVIGFEPLRGLSESLGLRNKWYLYGFLYSVAITGGAIYYLKRHGNSRYNRFRISVNVVIQLALGFSLPFIMPLFGGKEMYFSYFWPLKYDYLYPSTLADLPLYFALYTIVGSLIAAPLLAVFYGKRWYCSWICGCGGLANTFGDPWRHLTSKSTKSWRFEQFSIHIVLFVAIATTFLIGLDSVIGDEHPTFHYVVSGGSWSVKAFYGFAVGAVLAGVVGTGLYPLLGPRAWCRNFCPMAAILGWVQKVGRYRIRVKPDMCISCGNCSSYCEMGIDVRSYAQSNESFTRASCVGCGMCAHMCPRGVLKLENAWDVADDKDRQKLSVVNF